LIKLERIVSLLTILTYLFGIMVCVPIEFKGPLIHKILMTVLAGMPLIGIYLVRRYQTFVLLNGPADSPYPMATHLIIIPGPFLMIRGIFDYPLVDFKDLIIPVLSVSILFMVLVVKSSGEQKKALIAIFFVFSLAYGFGAVKHFNCAFDSRTAKTFEARVIGKRIQRVKKIPVPMVKLKAWGARKSANELEVQWEVYKIIGAGDKVKIITGPGLLGIPWVKAVQRAASD
jgi:hypothetical protein